MKTIKLLVAAVVFFGISGSVFAVEIPQGAKILPSNTVFLVEIEDFGQFHEQFKKTNLYGLYKDPAMGDFFESMKNKVIVEIEKDDGDLAELIKEGVLPTGRLIVAGSPPKSGNGVNQDDQAKSGEPIVIIITQWGENFEKVKNVIEESIKEVIDEGAHRKIESYRGFDIITVIQEHEPMEVPDFSDDQNEIQIKTVECAPTKTHHCYIDRSILFSTDEGILKFAIAHLKGATGATMYSESDYNSAMGVTGPVHDLDCYVNIKQLLESFKSQAPAQVSEMISKLGFDNVSSLAMSVALAREKQHPFVSKGFLKIDGEKKGVLRMLEMQEGSLEAPKFIPADAFSVSFFNIDIKKAFDELTEILNNFSPQYASMLHMDIVPPSPDGQPGVSLKRDVIAHLGDQLVISQGIDKPFSERSMPNYQFAIEVENRSMLEKSLAAIYDQFFPGDEGRRELLGYTIYDLGASLPFLMPGPGMHQLQMESGNSKPELGFAFTVTDTHLILAGKEAVAQAIRNLSGGGADSIVSQKWFNIAKKSIPQSAGWAGMQDKAAQMEYLWWALKNKKPKNSRPMNFSFHGPFDSEGPFGLDGSMLPEFEKVRKYFGLEASYGQSRGDGFYFEMKNIVMPTD